MYLKITDGDTTHYLHGADEIRVDRFAGYNQQEHEDERPDAANASVLHLFLQGEPSEPEPTHRDVVILQPVMGPHSAAPRTIITDFDVYLLNDQGKTIEVIHRSP